MDHISKNGAPIDFFAWHSYADVRRVAVMDSWLASELEKLGYGGLETHLNVMLMEICFLFSA